MHRLKDVPDCWKKIFPGLASRGITADSLFSDSRISTAWAPIAAPAQAQGPVRRGRYGIETYAGAKITYNNRGPHVSFADYTWEGLTPLDARALLVIHEYGHAADFLYGPAASTIISDGPQSSPTPGLPPFYSITNSDKIKEACFK